MVVPDEDVLKSNRRLWALLDEDDIWHGEEYKYEKEREGMFNEDGTLKEEH